MHLVGWSETGHCNHLTSSVVGRAGAGSAELYRRAVAARGEGPWRQSYEGQLLDELRWKYGQFGFATTDGDRVDFVLRAELPKGTLLPLGCPPQLAEEVPGSGGEDVVSGPLLCC